MLDCQLWYFILQDAGTLIIRPRSRAAELEILLYRIYLEYCTTQGSAVLQKGASFLAGLEIPSLKFRDAWFRPNFAKAKHNGRATEGAKGIGRPILGFMPLFWWI